MNYLPIVAQITRTLTEQQINGDPEARTRTQRRRRAEARHRR